MGKIELHTDALRRLFSDGSQIVCQVLHHSLESGYRVSVLHSQHTQRGNMPVVLAVTILNIKNWPPSFRRIDLQLQQGALMGEAFRKNGFTVQQNRLFNMQLTPKSNAVMRLLNLKPNTKLVVECYEFWADQYKYGKVIEFKIPQHAPKIHRNSLGTHHILQHLGVSTPTFHKWLHTEPTRLLDVCKLFLARIHGVIASFYLFFYSQKIIEQYSPTVNEQ